jgi:hypothetical protein
MKQPINEIKRMQQLAGVIKEGERTEKELYRLKQSFMPDFEEFVELNLIEKLEDNENIGYTKQEQDFARQLKQVLEVLKHGEI